MVKVLVALLLVLAVAVLAAQAWHLSDRRQALRAWRALAATAPPAGRRFEPGMVADLPEPARRYFGYTIAPGTPLSGVAEIEMGGELGLGTRDDPRYRPMRAEQILAPPHGFVWRVRTGAIAGSDGLRGTRSWTRFWLFGLLPMVRAGGADHARSTFARVVSEAVFWTPAALLPGPEVHWSPVDADTARVTVRHEGLEQSVEVTVAPDGQPVRVVLPRWSNANPEKLWQFQPFGGTLSEFRDFGGYRLPTRVDGGNFIGTPDYFPFYKAEVTALRMLFAAAE